MDKKILTIVLLVLCSSVALATNYQYLMNPYTRNLDRSNSLNQSGLNISGNLPWSDLYDYPVACPAYSYLTQLNDSVTCTSIPVQNSTSWERSGTDVYLANSGDRVGIGTDDPSSSLHVKTNGGKVMFEHTGATSSGWITFENSVQGRRGYIQGDAGDGAMRIDASGTGKIQIGNAQLGIGTVPSTTFHIKDAGGEIRWNINYE